MHTDTPTHFEAPTHIPKTFDLQYGADVLLENATPAWSFDFLDSPAVREINPAGILHITTGGSADGQWATGAVLGTGTLLFLEARLQMVACGSTKTNIKIRLNGDYNWIQLNTTSVTCTGGTPYAMDTTGYHVYLLVLDTVSHITKLYVDGTLRVTGTKGTGSGNGLNLNVNNSSELNIDYIRAGRVILSHIEAPTHF